jgi:hypothetical protein
MAYYTYKQLYEVISPAFWDRWLKDNGDGDDSIDPGYDGNLHAMAADYIKSLRARLAEIEGRLDDDGILDSFGICPDAGCTHPTCAAVRAYRAELRKYSCSP